MNTKVNNTNFQTGSLTSNLFAEGVLSGGGGGGESVDYPTIDEIVFTNSSFANTANTTIAASGGYYKIFGTNFRSDSEVILIPNYHLNANAEFNTVVDNYHSSSERPDLSLSNTQYVSPNELRVFSHIALRSSSSSRPYNLFLLSDSAGEIITKLSAMTANATVANQVGWWISGLSPGLTPAYTSQVERVDYSNDTISRVNDVTQWSTYGPYHLTGNATSSWQIGGNHPGAPAGGTRTFRYEHVTDLTMSSLRANCARSGLERAQTSNSTYVWAVGANNPTGKSYTVRMTMSNDTTLIPAAGNYPMTIARFSSVKNPSYAWFGGGATPSPAPSVTRIYRLQFSNDTYTLRSFLGIGVTTSIGATGFGDRTTYGYFAGGKSGTQSSDITRLTFATDTSNTVQRALLPVNCNEVPVVNATGSSKVYFGGGAFPGATTRVARYDMSNDTVNAANNVSLARTRTKHTCTASDIHE